MFSSSRKLGNVPDGLTPQSTAQTLNFKGSS